MPGNSEALLASNSRVYRSIPDSGNLLVTIAIGESVLREWELNALNLWLDYCNKWDIGLVVIVNDLIEKSSPFWKKATWQKLLLPSHILQTYPEVQRVCYIDTDVLISPIAPDIFPYVSKNKIGLVSLFNSLPYDRRDTLDKISFFRHTSSNRKYPLDSSLYMSIEDLYKFHSLKPQSDYACMGLIVFDVSDEICDKFESIFNQYKRDVSSITNGGDQTHLNFHFQAELNIDWLPYKWQAIWSYEAANKYPAAFWEGYATQVQDIVGSLSSNYFLHFAGSWTESQAWKSCQDIKSNEVLATLSELLASNQIQRTGNPAGLVRPMINSNQPTNPRQQQ